MLIMKPALFFVTFIALLSTAYCLLGYPLHASCKIDWTFGSNCTTVNEAIVTQIQKWKGPDNCQQGGEKCLYELISSNKTFIKSTHTTPVKKYIDDQTFQFNMSGKVCSVKGFSSSRTWYAVLDSGTNYCNLHNLIEGAGLDKTPGYKEVTEDSVCTQYTSSDCEKY